MSWAAQAALQPLVSTARRDPGSTPGERRILDFSAGLINVKLGHRHPAVVAAI